MLLDSMMKQGTCEMFVRQEVGNSIEAHGLTLTTPNPTLKYVSENCSSASIFCSKRPNLYFNSLILSYPNPFHCISQCKVDPQVAVR